MTGAATLRERIRTGEHLRGILLRVPSPMLVDMAGTNDFAFVLLDTEHGIADQKELSEHITAARAAHISTLVRVGEGEWPLVQRVLDAGAEGVVIPHVRDAAGATRAVRSAHYPPGGDRGFATYTAAGRWGKATAAEHVAAAERTLVVVMIEDVEGVQNATAIAATPGVDAVFVGPADLAASLGYDAEAADEGRRRVWSEAAKATTPVLAIVSTVTQARRAFEDGAQLVVLNAQAAIDACLGAWVTSS